MKAIDRPTNCKNCGAHVPASGVCEHCGTDYRGKPLMRSEMKITAAGITLSCEQIGTLAATIAEASRRDRKTIF